MVKKVIRLISYEEAKDMARQAMDMATVEEINEFAAQEMNRRFPEIFRFGTALAGSF
jgi:hypothetical protein